MIIYCICLRNLKKIVGSIKENRHKAEEQLEDLQYETSEFSAESVNNILLINSDLRKMVAGLDINSALSVIQGYLDSLPWKSKFRTGEIGKRGNNDSVYYVTPENISLRLKLSNMGLGNINEVIQPFMEKIVFEDDDNNISFEPEVGLTPQEYSSPEFIAMQSRGRSEGEFHSRIRTYIDASGRTVFIKNVPDGYVHTGSKINILS